MSNKEELIKYLESLSEEERTPLLESLGVKTPKKKPVKRKIVRKTTKKRGNIKVFDQNEALDDPEVKRATAVSKILSSGNTQSHNRQKVMLVKVTCPNCSKTYTVSPELAQKFVCCVRGKKRDE